MIIIHHGAPVLFPSFLKSSDTYFLIGNGAYVVPIFLRSRVDFEGSILFFHFFDS